MTVIQAVQQQEVVEFQKYLQRGAYHWQQIAKNPFRRNAYVLGRYQNVMTLVTEACGTLEGKTILEVGCGDGVLAYLLAKQGARVIGIDYSALAIDFAKQKTAAESDLHLQFQQASAYQLPFADAGFDMVISSDVIEHMTDVDQYLREIARVCQVGGKIVLSTPVRFTERVLDPEHVVEWFPNEFKALINGYFPQSRFYYSHPVALQELLRIHCFKKPVFKFVANLVSFLRNPFEGFQSQFQLMSLQYSVSEKCQANSTQQ